MRKPPRSQGRPTRITVRLTPEDRAILQAWQRSTTIPVGRARRARAVLLREQGGSISAIAETVGVARRFVYKWLARFLAGGVDALVDRPRTGPRGPRRPEADTAALADRVWARQAPSTRWLVVPPADAAVGEGDADA